MISHLFARTLALIVAILVLAAASPAVATSAVYLTDVEQARASTAVVVATVARVEVAAHETHRIVTRTSITVEQVLYGAAPDQLRVEQIGGTLDGVTVHVPGDARLEAGNRDVLFLRQVDGRWYLTAMEQSRYELRTGPSGSVTMHRDLHSGLYTRDSAGRLVEFSEPADPPPKLLAHFRAKMAALAVHGAK